MIGELINRTIVSVKPGTSLDKVCKLMKEKDVGAVFCCEDSGKPKGVVTDRDIVVRCIAEGEDPNEMTVDDLMKEPATCTEDEGVYEVIQKMRNAKVRRMPVLDKNGKMIGVLSFGDLLSMLSHEFYELVSTTTREEEYRKQRTEEKVA